MSEKEKPLHLPFKNITNEKALPACYIIGILYLPEGTNMEINISNLSADIYLVQLVDDKQTVTLKLVKH